MTYYAGWTDDQLEMRRQRLAIMQGDRTKQEDADLTLILKEINDRADKAYKKANNPKK